MTGNSEQNAALCLHLSVTSFSDTVFLKLCGTSPINIKPNKAIAPGNSYGGGGSKIEEKLVCHASSKMAIF